MALWLIRPCRFVKKQWGIVSAPKKTESRGQQGREHGVEFWGGDSQPLPTSYGVWGSAVSSPSGVRGKAPAAQSFWDILLFRKQTCINVWYITSIITDYRSRHKTIFRHQLRVILNQLGVKPPTFPPFANRTLIIKDKRRSRHLRTRWQVTTPHIAET